MARSLDGLVLAPVADQEPGQIGTRTRFTYQESDGRVWAEYAGGDVVRGHPVGRVRLEKRWDGESREGSGTSVVEELAP